MIGPPYIFSIRAMQDSTRLSDSFIAMRSGVISGLPQNELGMGKFLHENKGGNGYGQMIGSPAGVQFVFFGCIMLCVTCVQCCICHVTSASSPSSRSSYCCVSSASGSILLISSR